MKFPKIKFPKLTRFAKRNLRECSDCKYIKLNVKYKPRNRSRMKKASCLVRGIFIINKNPRCIFRNVKK